MDFANMETDYALPIVPSLADVCKRINDDIRVGRISVKIDVIFQSIPKATVEYSVEWLQPYPQQKGWLEVKFYEEVQPRILPLPLQLKYCL